MGTAHVDPGCPQCALADATRSVRSIVSSGTVTGAWASGTSDLAARLAQPARPSSGSLSDDLTIFFWLGVPAVFFIVTGFTNMKDGNRSGLGVTLLWLLAGVVFAGLFLWVYVRSQRRASYDRSAWKRQMEAWTRLSYCARCDLVWGPERITFPPERRSRLY